MIVVKCGGRVIKDSFDILLRSVLQYNDKIILVHGGGDIVNEYSKKMGIDPLFVTSPEGIRSRYTSKEELDVYIMVMNLINKKIVTSLVSNGKKSIGLTGADGPIVLAERKKRIVIIDERGKKRIIDGGYTGKITQVNSNYIFSLLTIFDDMIIAPLAVDINENTLLNVDGDQMAFNIAKATKADILILLTDVNGVMIEGKIINNLSADEARDLSRKVGAGMNRKLLMASEAVNSGVKKVIIAQGKIEDSINNALKGNGTVIS
jgi:acetylglutamate/LysW-gamma-L-alpha-aminoadipate kinase